MAFPPAETPRFLVLLLTLLIVPRALLSQAQLPPRPQAHSITPLFSNSNWATLLWGKTNSPGPLWVMEKGTPQHEAE